MSKMSTIEQIESLFMPAAFEIVKEQHADIEDTEALFLAQEMLWYANSIYDKAIKKGKTESEALSRTFHMFSNAYQSVAS